MRSTRLSVKRCLHHRDAGGPRIKWTTAPTRRWNCENCCGLSQPSPKGASQASPGRCELWRVSPGSVIRKFGARTRHIVRSMMQRCALSEPRLRSVFRARRFCTPCSAATPPICASLACGPPRPRSLRLAATWAGLWRTFGARDSTHTFTFQPSRYAARFHSFSPSGLSMSLPVLGSQRTTVLVR
jgi:hypothetical protein